MRRKTKTKIKFLHKSQIPSTLDYGKRKKQLKELKLGCYIHFFSCFREYQPYRTQVTAKISLVSQRLERKVKIRVVEEYNTLGSLAEINFALLNTLQSKLNSSSTHFWTKQCTFQEITNIC